MKTYDAIIIGFGKAGKTLAADLGKVGKSVAVIERSNHMYGGTCINVGCIPSKFMKRSAEESSALGGDFDAKAQRYYNAVMAREKLTAKLREKNYNKLKQIKTIDVIDGRALFLDPNTIEVDLTNGHPEEMTAPIILINTGASPRRLRLSNFSQRLYNSQTLMALPKLPRRLIVVGGGYIGLEFASMYAHFGSQVTIVQDTDAFLPREDEEISAAVLQRLKDLGVKVIFSAQNIDLKDGEGMTTLTADTKDGKLSLEAEAVLGAIGRVPNTGGMNLKAGGIEMDSRGAIKVDEHLKSSNPKVYAAGDVKGGLQFTYISLDDYRILKSTLLGDGSRTTQNRGAVPYSVFFDPILSRVGLTEKQAKEQGYHIQVAKLPAASIPKAQVLGQTDGLLKAVIDADTGLILGAHLFCAESHEMINLLKLAMDAKIPYATLKDAIYTHPTMTESLNML